jgi:hypothetical protein
VKGNDEIKMAVDLLDWESATTVNGRRMKVGLEQPPFHLFDRQVTELALQLQREVIWPIQYTPHRSPPLFYSIRFSFFNFSSPKLPMYPFIYLFFNIISIWEKNINWLCSENRKFEYFFSD